MCHASACPELSRLSSDRKIRHISGSFVEEQATVAAMPWIKPVEMLILSPIWYDAWSSCCLHAVTACRSTRERNPYFILQEKRGRGEQQVPRLLF